MDELVKSCSSRIKAAILIGSDGPLIASALAKNAPEIPIHHVNEYSDSLDLMNKVVAVAAELAVSGDTVLLVPRAHLWINSIITRSVASYSHNAVKGLFK